MLKRDPSGDFQLDPDLLAGKIGIEPSVLRRRMRLGLVTSRVEIGEGEDLGRWRLTVRSGQRIWRLIVNESGEVLSEERHR